MPPHNNEDIELVYGTCTCERCTYALWPVGRGGGGFHEKIVRLSFDGLMSGQLLCT